MIRTDRYKYNFNEGTLGELYDLEQDPGELRNRIDDPSMAAVRRRLHDQLFAWYRPERNPFRPARFR